MYNSQYVGFLTNDFFFIIQCYITSTRYLSDIISVNEPTPRHI